MLKCDKSEHSSAINKKTADVSICYNSQQDVITIDHKRSLHFAAFDCSYRVTDRRFIPDDDPGSVRVSWPTEGEFDIMSVTRICPTPILVESLCNTHATSGQPIGTDACRTKPTCRVEWRCRTAESEGAAKKDETRYSFRISRIDLPTFLSQPSC